MADTRIFLTTPGAGSWTVPADCTSATIECIGGGGNGGNNSSYGGTGGGGGAYSKKNSLSLTPGASISYQVGAAATDTWFKSTADVLAKGGISGWNKSNANAEAGALGGQAVDCVGDVKYNGGAAGYYAAGYYYQSSGGGAAGLNGAGNPGIASNLSGYGGSGDAGYGGAGGTTGAGGAGTEWDATHGSGGGGAGSSSGDNGKNGGLYGGGGGGGKYVFGGSGIQGLIVITYTPFVAPLSNASFLLLMV